MVAPPMLVCVAPQTAFVVEVAAVVAPKPPWNQPQLTFFAFSGHRCSVPVIFSVLPAREQLS